MESKIKELEERVSELELKILSSEWPEMKISTLERDQKGDLKVMAIELGINVKELTRKELARFCRSYERQFRLDAIHYRHRRETFLGAMIAKHQLGEFAELDGEIPAKGKVQGPVTIRASWFGVGDDWYDVAPWIPGEWNTWIDVVVHDAVHVVYGVQSLLETPLIEAVQFRIDGFAKAVQQTHFTEKSGKLKIREFDSAYIFKEYTTVKVDVFLSKNVPDPIDFPKLYGVSFVPYGTALELEE